MKTFLNNFLLMFQFLTRIPINKSLECQHENFRHGAVFLPIVGLVIGGIQWIFYYILGQVLPSNITAVFVVLAGVIVTGALHVDGLGDTCDGFFAFKGRDRIIEIMKDSRIGTFACIALVGDMALKIMSTDVLVKNRAGLMIIAAPVIGRFSIEFISLIAKPAKSTGSGNLFIGNMSVGIVVLSGLITAAISFLIIGAKPTIVIMPSALILTIMINLYSKSKIGGLTGDLLGANNELVEILSMLLFIAINHL